MADPSNQRTRHRMMALSLVTGMVMLIGKLYAYSLTNSSAILADAAESVVHVFATAFAAFSLWYSERPADVNHPYGHGRIAYFSIGFEGALVVSAAMFAMWKGISALVLGTELHRIALGLSLAGGLACINLAVALSLISVGRKQGSLILVANGKHVLADVLTTAAAVIGIGLVLLTGKAWLDPAAAIVIGLLILRSGLSLVRQAVAGLMDELDPVILERLVRFFDDAVDRKQIDGYHQLRCRAINQEMWIDVHLILPSQMPLLQAHQRATDLEESLQRTETCRTMDRVHITSHLEPVDHDVSHPGGHVPPDDPLTGQSR